ncbi:MAG: 30S ribosome-binding factor RbfA [Bacteroidia bacterium]|nr:30S ribosome-binding factor RbfA [Bacteroidia bacterium]MDW8333955.1 30S ribosome-binding factor RbfA [Bacteroidia bacterium]
MDSTRQKKFSALVKREISDLIRKEVEPVLGVMITVNHVSATADLQIARVYVTVWPEKESVRVLQFLGDESKQLRFELAKRLKNTVRVMPELKFYEDDTLKTALHLDELFNRIREQEERARTERDPAVE